MLLQNQTRQPTSLQTAAAPMVSVQVGYEGNGQRRGEEVALDKVEVHDQEEKCKIQAYARVNIIRMTGKKISHDTDQNPKLEE